MKKLLLLLVIIALVGGIWYYFNRPNTTSAPVQTVSSVPVGSHPDMSNATFSFDDGSVTLKKGSSEDAIADSAATQDTTLTDLVGYGDLNNDGKEDAAGLIVQTGGGSGEFLYLVAYVSGTVTYKGTNAVFVGDRIQSKTISIKNGVITLNYLDRTADESFADDPTLSVSKQFVVIDGTLQAK